LNSGHLNRENREDIITEAEETIETEAKVTKEEEITGMEAKKKKITQMISLLLTQKNLALSRQGYWPDIQI